MMLVQMFWILACAVQKKCFDVWCLCRVEITASHNPVEYNGMKIVKAGSQPLDEVLDFKR